MGADDVRFVVACTGVRTRQAALLLSALALASACTGSTGKPQVLPSLTATQSPTATPVVVPSAATVHDSFGAAAFVRFYYAQLNRAYSTADAAPLAGLADPACGTCRSYSEAMSDLRRKGQRIEGDSIRIVSAEAPPEANGYVAVDLFFVVPARKVVSTSGQVLESLPQSRQLHKTVYVMHVTSGWLVRAVKDAT